MNPEDEQRQLDHARRALLDEFTDRVDASEVEQRFSEMVRQFSSAPVRSFVPVLVHRQTREHLRHRASH